ncbi:MAG: membrane protein YqaA with SNARE-associated domain [Rickettsiales bacterium]|jgi:membrane protein YqaA with SNARE-associated domain
MNYLFLFFDSLNSATILPIHNEMAIHALLAFDKQNSYLIFIVTLLASTFGSSINWFIGKKLQYFKKTSSLKNKKPQINDAEKKWDKYLVWMLLLAPLKIIINPLSVLAGFLNTGFKKFLIIIFASKFIYYSWIVNFSI